ncbi:MAG: archaemetzincin family Zn-dependent metalloprotease [bacterium]|nr:archaemetzincin family Zn-dependent metalloprotease [bacterium]
MWILGISFLFLDYPAKIKVTNSTIALVPVGEVDTNVISFLKESLQARFTRNAIVDSGFKIPESAYNPKRGQYLSTPIVKFISDSIKNYEKVLGLIDVDLYVPGLNFIFGEAESIGGRVGIISLTRLRQEFYSLPVDTNLFFKRALKEAVHELGHLYGLSHCNNSKCVMYFSNSLLDTDHKGVDFCQKCRHKL